MTPDPKKPELPGCPVRPQAQWVVELNVDCPKCEQHVNLLDYVDFWDGRQLDIPEHMTERSKNQEAVCPECGHEFVVECVW